MHWNSNIYYSRKESNASLNKSRQMNDKKIVKSRDNIPFDDIKYNHQVEMMR